MKVTRLLLALAAILPGCAQPEEYAGSPPPASRSFINDPAAPELALLEFLLGEYFRNAGEQPGTVCAAGMRGERVPLPEDTELALMKRFPALAPFARCVWKDGRYVDAMTGDNARVYHVARLVCERAGRCTALGGFIAANLGAEYSEFRLTFEDGAWLIERGEIMIMS